MLISFFQYKYIFAKNLWMFNLKEIFTAGMILFAVIDIIGSIPIIIELKKKVGYIQSEKASAFSARIFAAISTSSSKLAPVDTYT